MDDTTVYTLIIKNATVYLWIVTIQGFQILIKQEV